MLYKVAQGPHAKISKAYLKMKKTNMYRMTSTVFIEKCPTRYKCFGTPHNTPLIHTMFMFLSIKLRKKKERLMLQLSGSVFAYIKP